MSDTPRERQHMSIDYNNDEPYAKETAVTPKKKRTEEATKIDKSVLFRHHFLRVPLTLLFMYQFVFALIGQLQEMNKASTIPNPPHHLDLPCSNTPSQSKEDRSRLAVASFLDHPTLLFGTYSIHQQIKRTGMNVPYVVMIPDTFPKTYPAEYKVLVDMIGGEKNIFAVDQDFIFRKLAKNLWKETFNKLWLFSLVDYDKLIILDQDILIRQNIMHWFDYPAPAATQAGDSIEWNSGAMVIEPNHEIFQQMVDLLPNVTRLDLPAPETNAYFNYDYNNNSTVDGWNSGVGQQGFLSAFFTQESFFHNNNNRTFRMKTMPTEASILISSFKRPQFQYFVHHRLYMFETVHFTLHKPWRSKKTTRKNHVCDMLREWKVSMQGFEKYNATIRLDNDYLRSCPPPPPPAPAPARQRNHTAVV